MQKLTRKLNRWIANNRGSALVIAVVLALIMAIAGIGFLFVTTSSINNDSDAYSRDRAFYAAESGALIGAKWLMSRCYNSWPMAASHAFLSNKLINGHYVNVTFRINTASRIDTVKAEAFTSNTVQNATTFRKRVIIIIQNDGF